MGITCWRMDVHGYGRAVVIHGSSAKAGYGSLQGRSGMTQGIKDTGLHAIDSLDGAKHTQLRSCDVKEH